MKKLFSELSYKSVHWMQKRLLLLSYWICALGAKNKWLWVIGTGEVANNLKFIAAVLDRAYSVNFFPHPFYRSNTYDFSMSAVPSNLSSIVRIIVGPILLGYLAHRASGFFYIGNQGFLIDKLDGKEYEFAFLKKRGKKIVNFFCGSDIRSIRLAQEHAAKLKLEVIATYYPLMKSYALSDEHENFLKITAQSADKYADLIFSAPMDQISYLKRDVSIVFHAYPNEWFVRNDQKFTQLSPIIIVHAPSAPIIKGTQLVRAAIKKLQIEGYLFEYIELQHVSNKVVLDHLRRAHIVINELYAFIPGLFGIEAMASHCALLTSADRDVETLLPEGAHEAWFVTRYWEVYDNLKHLLDNPDLIKRYADKGFQWTQDNHSASEVKKNLRTLLKKTTSLSED